MLGYYLSLPFIYILAYLPFSILYLVSDFFFFLLFHVVGYRRSVVEQNLRNSFPDKSETEIKALSIKYYKYLCDLILESLKKINIDELEALDRCEFVNKDLLQRLFSENKSVILLMGHYGNWEWGGSSFSLSNQHTLHVVYKPLSNPYFEKLMCKTRTMFGTKLIKMDNTLRDIVANKNTLSAFAFIADQTPAPEHAYWTKFLNQDTPLFLGAEKIARKMYYPVLFVNIVRVKRGYYKIFSEVLSEEPKNTKPYEITESYIRRLEQEIEKMPEIWLWSHRRWKHFQPKNVLVA